MAQGKQTPRQKMINLMYLVFIAMMALNIDAEIIRSYYDSTRALNETRTLTERKNEKIFERTLEAKAQQVPDTYAQPWAQYKVLKAKIDALVNCAGYPGPTGVLVETINWSDFQKVIEVNLYGAIWLTQAVLPGMKKQKYGRIVQVASIAGKEGNPKMSPYNTAKAGLIGFVKGVAKEVATDGITINSLAPAVIATPININTAKETLDYMISKIPAGRLGEPSEVAEIIAFMGSKACSFTTGFTFDISGGRATY